MTTDVIRTTDNADTATASADTERIFRRLVANTLITGVTSSFLWFAVTFWVFLETRSVVATGVIGAAFGLSSALIGPAFGTFVDRHAGRPDRPAGHRVRQDITLLPAARRGMRSDAHAGRTQASCPDEDG